MKHLRFGSYFKVSNEIVNDADFFQSLTAATIKQEWAKLTKRKKRYCRVSKIRIFDQDGDNIIKNMVTVVTYFETLHPKRKRSVFSKQRKRINTLSTIK